MKLNIKGERDKQLRYAFIGLVDYEQIMRLPNLNFYVRLPGEYPPCVQ
ncbi:TPA: hypothetical protein ACT92G_004562 [Enterobacter hormaechei subsp. steigerwaltii]